MKNEKEIEKKYRQTKNGGKSYRNMVIMCIVWSIFLVISIALAFIEINERVYYLLSGLEDIMLWISLCFDSYYLGGLKEFKMNYQKES